MICKPRQAIPKQRVWADGGSVKVEPSSPEGFRGSARGCVASNTLTALPGARQSPPGIAFAPAFLSLQWDSNYRWSMNSSRVKPACSTIPFTVPGLSGLCCGTTTVLGPWRRMRCEPDCRSWTNPQRFNARTASTPLRSRGIFTTPPGWGLAKSATGRCWDAVQARNSPQRHRRSSYPILRKNRLAS